VTTLRYFNAAGCMPDGSLGESHKTETHLIPLAIAAAMGNRPPLSLFGTDYDTRDGTCIRDYIHVLDLADAHVKALRRLLAGDPGDAYNVGTGVGTTVREVLAAIGRSLGTEVPHAIAERRPGDPPALFAAADKIRRDLEWVPQWTDIDSIVDTAVKWAKAPRY
ncbi:MAG: NAD-dependent epimerase/dehydratase family protein, partial [Myxococcota bacterium]|nr:NAD-dependent epimerase/dehydratase family protein [Myxococcota bacterium]